MALCSHFRGCLTRTDIVTVLFKRIENINIEEVEAVLPNYKSGDDHKEYMRSFVSTTQVLFTSREYNVAAYKAHIKGL